MFSSLCSFFSRNKTVTVESINANIDKAIDSVKNPSIFKKNPEKWAHIIHEGLQSLPVDHIVDNHDQISEKLTILKDNLAAKSKTTVKTRTLWSCIFGSSKRQETVSTPPTQNHPASKKVQEAIDFLNPKIKSSENARFFLDTIEKKIAGLKDEKKISRYKTLQSIIKLGLFSIKKEQIEFLESFEYVTKNYLLIIDCLEKNDQTKAIFEGVLDWIGQLKDDQKKQGLKVLAELTKSFDLEEALQKVYGEKTRILGLEGFCAKNKEKVVTADLVFKYCKEYQTLS